MFDVPNLDGFEDSDELRDLADVLTLLSLYAKAKAAAQTHRAAGLLGTALQLEAYCEHVYGQLPEWARW